MFRIALALFGLLVLSGCQDPGTPQTPGEKCSSIDMQIAAAQENDSLQADAKAQMIEGLVQEKAALNCP